MGGDQDCRIDVSDRFWFPQVFPIFDDKNIPEIPEVSNQFRNLTLETQEKAGFVPILGYYTQTVKPIYCAAKSPVELELTVVEVNVRVTVKSHSPTHPPQTTVAFR